MARTVVEKRSVMGRRRQQMKRLCVILREMALRQRELPQALGNTIFDLLSRFDADGRFELVRLIRLWPEIVGEGIARRTEVSGLKFHTAVVRVSGAMWLQELNLMKPQILAQLHRLLGADVIHDLRFVSGRLSRREHSRLKPIARGARRYVELPDLRDHELRQAFDSLIEAWGRASR